MSEEQGLLGIAMTLDTNILLKKISKINLCCK